MRIHWAVVIFAVIGTILLTWHFRTRHLDFMPARGLNLGPEDDGSDLALRPTSLQPKIDPTSKITEVLGNPEKPDKTIVAEITDQDLGDLKASPGLDTYLPFAKAHSPDRLFELSSSLRARGQLQRALLALERVIDTSKANPANLDEAAKGISTLAPSLPTWNVDPTSQIALMLHLGTANTANHILKSAALEVATLIRTSSSDQLEIIPKITSSRKQDIPVDRILTLWLSTTGTKPTSTAIMTFKTTDNLEQTIDQIALAVFQTVRSHLGYPTQPPLQAPGKDLVSTYTSRLMWRDFAQSLYQPPIAQGAAEEN